jgi:tRNA A-37 threonylcarbamoyl transferase component Bud32
MSEGGGSPRRPGPDNSGTLAIARTVPSDARIVAVGSADTLLASEAAEPSSPSQRGEVLGGRYAILAELGRGAEGVVYRARDLKADTVVALKLLQHDEGSDERLLRFRRELQLARKVTHPNVVRIYDLVELPGRFGLSMELVDGVSLESRIARGPLTREELVRLAVDLARALAAAHEAGVTHRDLKPANVLLRRKDGHAVVTDFGVSRAHADADARVSSQPTPGGSSPPVALTREGTLIGTPLYMAPEQLEARADIGPAADVYAYGAVLFEAATGKALHEAETIGDVLRLRTAAPAPPLHDARPDLPRVLCDVVDRALKRDDQQRFPSGAELVAALEPLSNPASARRGGSSRVLALALVALVALGGVAGASVYARRPAPAPAATAAPPPGPATPPLVLTIANQRRITFGDACEEFPSFLPDDSAVVYDATVGRDSYVYRLGLEPGATPKALTHVRGWDFAATASPDGKRIAFVRLEAEHTGAWVAPIDGSEPPHLVVKGGMRPSWTRDGAALWAGTGAPIASYDVATGALRSTIVDGPPVKTAITQELADGSLLVTLPAHAAVDSIVGGVAILRTDAPPRWLLKQPMEETLAVTPDGKHVLAARDTLTGVELMDLPLDGSPPASLASTGIDAHQGLAVSGDGAHVVWSSCREVPQLVTVEGRDTTFRTLRVDIDGPSSMAAIPNRPEVLVVSTRAGKAAPWIVPLGGGAPRALAVGKTTPSEIAASQDGTRFVVAVPDHGLQIGSLAGDPALRPLTNDGLDSAPAFRSGDRQVVFTHRRPDGKPQLMTVPVEGGEPTQLVGAGSDGAAPSPVDDRIAYVAGTTMNEVVPMLWDGRAGSLRPLSPKLPAGRYGYLRFSPDGRRVALIRGQTELVEVDVASGSVVRKLSTPADDQIAVPTYVPGALVMVRIRWQGNLWMADVSR